MDSAIIEISFCYMNKFTCASHLAILEFLLLTEIIPNSFSAKRVIVTRI